VQTKAHENAPHDRAVPTPRRTRVLVVSHLYPASPEDTAGVFVREQVEAVAEHVDVTVVIGRYGIPTAHRTELSANLTTIEVPLPKLPARFAAAGVLRAVPAYRRAVEGVIADSLQPFDIVHAHFGAPDGIAAIGAARTFHLPCVVTMHGADYNRQLQYPVIGSMVGRRLATADRIIAVSPAIAEGMRARFGLDARRVPLLHNGYNERDVHFHDASRRRNLLFVGTLSERKNPEALVAAFAQVAPEFAADLVLVGDGPLRARLEDQVRKLGLVDRVHLAGQRPHWEIDEMLAEAVALVLPSSSEGMPIVVNEALASGTPVIASRLPGTEVQVTSDSMGRLVPAGDVNALAQALRVALGSTWDHAAIARQCGIPSWSEYAKTLEALYSEVLAKRRGNPVT